MITQKNNGYQILDIKFIKKNKYQYKTSNTNSLNNLLIPKRQNQENNLKLYFKSVKMFMKQGMQSLQQNKVSQYLCIPELPSNQKFDEGMTNGNYRSGQITNEKFNINSSDIWQLKNKMEPQAISSKQNIDRCASVTDRFIPTRKQLFKEYIMNRGKQVQSISDNKRSLEIRNISDLYNVSFLSPKNSRDNFFNFFHNQNQLRYVQKKTKLKNQNIFNDDPFNLNISNLEFTTKRKINKNVSRVLDAPTLQDDYYLNLLDWSYKNIMAVALSSNLYLWNASTFNVTKLCQVTDPEIITSISWNRSGQNIAIGGSDGQVNIWDVDSSKKIRTMKGHTGRVTTIGWNYNSFSTGSRDKTILHRDLRSPCDYSQKLKVHKQQVCGLKWTEDSQYLCSGGNDNNVFIWSSQSNLPVWNFDDHIAAVKAIAWSPHKHGLLATGGGTADQSIKFRNILTGQCLKSVKTNSQVCNLMFSKTVNEIVSTHGYCNNEVKVWQYPSMQNVATLTGHTMRVLYIAMSPDGSTVVTGAGDQTLRFWNIFPRMHDSSTYVENHLNSSIMQLR